MRVIVFILLFFASSAFAAAPEIACDGIDDSLATGGSAAGTKGSCPADYHDALIGNGCDADCTLDKDGDGYAYTDCDDTRADVYPGVYVPNSFTSPTGYKLCQTNGIYGSTVLTATAALCEATGSGVCRYVDCANSLGAASNSNPGTSYSAPKLTLAAAAALEGPDDFTYLIGTGTCSENITLTTAGTSGHVITEKNYPGSTAKLVTTTTTATSISLSTATVDFRKFDNLDIDAGKYGIDLVSGVSDVEISRSYFHDLEGNENDNSAYIRATSTNRTNFHHNFFKNPTRTTGSSPDAQNIAAITWIDSAGGGGGADHYAGYNTCWWSTYDAANNGLCWYVKHGVTAAEAGTNGHQIKNNTAINFAHGGLNNGTSKLRAMYNRFWAGADDVGAFALVDTGGSNIHQDERFQYNTIIRSGNAPITWNPMYSGAESLLLDHNIIIDTDSTYVSGNGDGVIKIDTYGSDAQKATVDAGELTSNFNCFYSPNATAVFDYFGQNSGAGGHGPAGNAGGRYSFANWVTTVIQDGNSFLQNPGVASPKYEPTGNCATFGATQAPPLDPTPTPTPTPTPESGINGTARITFGRRTGK